MNMDRAWEYQAAAGRMDEAARSMRGAVRDADQIANNFSDHVSTLYRHLGTLGEYISELDRLATGAVRERVRNALESFLIDQANAVKNNSDQVWATGYLDAIDAVRKWLQDGGGHV